MLNQVPCLRGDHLPEDEAGEEGGEQDEEEGYEDRRAARDVAWGVTVDQADEWLDGVGEEDSEDKEKE